MSRCCVVSFVSLFGLYVVIDGVQQPGRVFHLWQSPLLEDASRCWPSTTRRGCLQFFDKIAGLLAMSAAAFVLTGIPRTNELTALMAAGIAPSRVIRPLLGASLVVALLAAANREVRPAAGSRQPVEERPGLVGETGRKCTPGTTCGPTF